MAFRNINLAFHRHPKTHRIIFRNVHPVVEACSVDVPHELGHRPVLGAVDRGRVGQPRPHVVGLIVIRRHMLFQLVVAGKINVLKRRKSKFSWSLVIVIAINPDQSPRQLLSLPDKIRALKRARKSSS